MSDAITDRAQGPRSQWCLVGNVVADRPFGPGGEETRRGTRHFSAGTKVYCLPAQWGDGYEDIVVIGRHRGTRRYVRLVMPAEYITNWRAQVVYSPEVLRLLHEATAEPWQKNWLAKQDIEAYVTWLNERAFEEASAKLKHT